MGKGSIAAEEGRRRSARPDGREERQRRKAYAALVAERALLYSVTCRCGYGRSIPPSSRERRYVSVACKQRAYRRRRAATVTSQR